MSISESFDDTQSLLSLDDHETVLRLLQEMDVCGSTETIIETRKAGDGNMNLVMRVTTSCQSVIVKQARPWVEKYPAIAAPSERILAEIDFYKHVANVPELANVMPAVLSKNSDLRIVVLQDLGEASDYSSLYAGSVAAKDSNRVFCEAINWLRKLHAMRLSADANVGCDSLRELNHAHMFTIPLSDQPAIELDTICAGLAEASEPIRTNGKLMDDFVRLGQVYLRPDQSNAVLLHGDYYPGSWLDTTNGFRVIDPEFCFCGPPEFDLGVLSAHWILCHAKPGIETVRSVVRLYGHDVSMPLVLGFAGVELIRRLIGVAQLPLLADLETRNQWLTLGKNFVGNSIGN